MPVKQIALLQKISSRLQKIPRGCVTTYGDLARTIGKPRAARAVGQALKRNTDRKRCPCFLVVRSDGEIGGYILGKKEKMRRLRTWGVPIVHGKVPKTYFQGFSKTSKR